MALKIRLTRLGNPGKAFYRVIVADSRSPRDGKFIAVLGTYDPAGDGKTSSNLDKNATLEWLAKGATPTETTRVVLEKAGILEKKKVVKKTTKKPAPVKKPEENKKGEK